MKASREQLGLALLPLAALVSIWEVTVTRLNPSAAFWFPAPSVIADTAVRQLLDARFHWHVFVSMSELFTGYGVVLATAIPIGLVMGLSRQIRLALEPYIMAFMSMPRIALIPLIIIWFGIGFTQKIVMVTLVAFFPLCINTIVGVRDVDPLLVKAGRAYGAKGWRLIREVVLPSAVPSIIAGMRLAFGSSLIGMVFAEMYGSSAGLGYLIAFAGQRFDMAAIFAVILVLMATGVTVSELLRRLEARLMPLVESQKR